MEVTDAIREFVEGKVSKLPKFLDNIQSIEVILDKEALKSVTEIVVTAKKKHVFVATHQDDDLYASVDRGLEARIEQRPANSPRRQESCPKGRREGAHFGFRDVSPPCGRVWRGHLGLASGEDLRRDACGTRGQDACVTSPAPRFSGNRNAPVGKMGVVLAVWGR
jgi:ribosomal subunit interface protein